ASPSAAGLKGLLMSTMTLPARASPYSATTGTTLAYSRAMMTMSPAGTAPHFPVVAPSPRALASAAALSWSRPMTSRLLLAAIASVPMVRAMVPVPMMLMLLMRWSRSPSDRRGAAVGDQLHPVHITGVVRGKEQRDRRDLLGAAHLSARDQGLELPLRLLVEQLLLLRRGDLPRVSTLTRMRRSFSSASHTRAQACCTALLPA